MNWLLYLLALGLGVGVLFQERRLQRLERGRHLDRIRIDNVVACSRHQQRAGEIVADSLGDVRRKLAEHAVDIVNHADEIHSLQTQMDIYVGDDVKPAPNPWINRGGLN